MKIVLLAQIPDHCQLRQWRYDQLKASAWLLLLRIHRANRYRRCLRVQKSTSQEATYGSIHADTALGRMLHCSGDD
jgi:hypothetical protein